MTSKKQGATLIWLQASQKHGSFLVFRLKTKANFLDSKFLKLCRGLFYRAVRHNKAVMPGVDFTATKLVRESTANEETRTKRSRR